MQSNHGFEGQINACWAHKLTRGELNRIRSAGILVSIIHGRLACNFSSSPLTVTNQFYRDFFVVFSISIFLILVLDPQLNSPAYHNLGHVDHLETTIQESKKTNK